MFQNSVGSNIKPPNKQIALIMSWIYESGLTTTSGGNISIREEKPLGEVVPIEDEEIQKLNDNF